MFRLTLLALVALVVAGCPGDDEPPVDPIFPADYAATYQQVRDCRRSGDHDLNYIRVWGDPIAVDTYLARDQSFPEGSMLVKEEFVDEACTDRHGWTVMRREAGFDPERGDWHWQRLDVNRRVTEDGVVQRCVGCHTACGVAPDGHDGTCAAPDQ